MRGRRIATVIGIAIGSGGCWHHQSAAPPLHPESFYRPLATMDDHRSPDNAGALVPRNTRAVPEETPPAPSQQEVKSIAPAVKDVVKPENPSAADAPPSTPPPATAGSTGQYYTLGSVVTQVSGTPIYADKVMQALAPELSAEAKRRDFASYRAFAKQEIDKQVNVMIREEVQYAAAIQNLSPDEKTLAENLTMNWRQRQVTEAGGSIENARHKTSGEGIDFDEKARDQYRTYVVQIFYQKKVLPKVQVTAQDMRSYYEQHLRSDFTDSESAKFRLIRVDAAKAGGREQAIEKIRDLHVKAARGDDFEKLASGFNDDPNLLRTGGRVGGADGWVQHNAFAIQKVEDAVWKLQPGHVSDVIEVGDSFFISKLEDRKLGRVRSFEDPAVQQQIAETLRRQQIAIGRDQVLQRLMKEAVLPSDPPVTDSVLEMALQKYPQWAQAK